MNLMGCARSQPALIISYLLARVSGCHRHEEVRNRHCTQIDILLGFVDRTTIGITIIVAQKYKKKKLTNTQLGF